MPIAADLACAPLTTQVCVCRHGCIRRCVQKSRTSLFEYYLVICEPYMRNAHIVHMVAPCFTPTHVFYVG